MSAVLLVVILGAGIFLRVWPSASFNQPGRGDEFWYKFYVGKAAAIGLTNYGRVIDESVTWQASQHDAIIPATRIGFIWPASIFAALTGVDSLQAVRWVSALSTILLLFVTTAIGWRFASLQQTLVLTALMAVAPLQIYLSQRSLIDGYFALLATLCAWFFAEAIRAPKSRGWLVGYAATFFVLVLTKENAAFVCVALMATWVVFAIRRLEPVNFAIPIATFVAGAAAVLVLASLLGGLSEWLTFYRMYTQKSASIPYVMKFQDGAWYRYLIDFTLMSPVIVALVMGSVFGTVSKSRIDVFWMLFLGFNFLAMSWVPYGLNLRFAAYWDEPMRWLAAAQLLGLSGHFSGYRRTGVLVVAVALVMVVDLSQYDRFFVRETLYEPVSDHLLRASKLVK